MIKTLKSVGREPLCLNIIKPIYESPEANLLNGEKPNYFPLRSGGKQGSPTLLLLFNIVLEILEQLGKKKKRYPNWKGRSKIALADGTLKTSSKTR